MSDGGTSESAGGERDAISARSSAISASRVSLAACAADRRVVTVLCAMLCQQPFHTTQLHKRQVEGCTPTLFKTHKQREQPREEREVLRKTNGRAHPRPLKVAGTSSA